MRGTTLLTNHELFANFFAPLTEEDPKYDHVTFEPLPAVSKFKEDYHDPCTRLSEAHKTTTNNISVTVIPFFMGFNKIDNLYWVGNYLINIFRFILL